MHKVKHKFYRWDIRPISNKWLDHWKVVTKVFRYLSGTKEYMLTYRGSNHLEVIGYYDSDFDGYVNSRKFIFGYLFMLVGWAISWKSENETIITTFTMEAKFMACFEATNKTLWFRNFIFGLKIIDNIHRLLKINCDNFVVVYREKKK